MAEKKIDLTQRKKLTVNPYYFVPEKVEHEYVKECVIEEQELVNGVLVTKNTVKKVDARDRDKGLNYWDFSIDSLKASGAISDLKFSSLSGDKMDIADQLDTNSTVLDKNIEG